ncbi:hypothetical protein BE221DRAFT_175802 [Ostreococcus tauri]|uniref:Uncharacterized protein n=1 Tax=Ostreococcus tauri TaxID=70448 RepID=A0A1Y5IDY6_OSTTA|nr:hypothetical protein BE221DRAFT_175802 [Ostreococcus tauri]
MSVSRLVSSLENLLRYTLGMIAMHSDRKRIQRLERAAHEIVHHVDQLSLVLRRERLQRVEHGWERHRRRHRALSLQRRWFLLRRRKFLSLHLRSLSLLRLRFSLRRARD